MSYRMTTSVCPTCGVTFEGRAATPSAPAQKFCSQRCAKDSLAIPLIDKFWAGVQQGDGCWEWVKARTPAGYGIFGHRGVVQYAHRVSWVLHFGPIPKRHQVCHHCDNPPCVRPDHLFVGTAQDNLRDMAAKGRQGLHRDPSRAVRGEAHHMARLTEEQVRMIRSDPRGSTTLAKALGVSKPTIQRIRSRKTWAHVD